MDAFGATMGTFGVGGFAVSPEGRGWDFMPDFKILTSYDASAARREALASARRRSSVGSGQPATSVPAMNTSPPIHSQLTSGLT